MCHQQIMCLLQACETSEGNAQWASHVCDLRSQVNVNNVNVERVKESAKSYIEDLKRGNRWKKDAATNKTAFPTQPATDSSESFQSNLSLREITFLTLHLGSSQCFQINTLIL